MSHFREPFALCLAKLISVDMDQAVTEYLEKCAQDDAQAVEQKAQEILRQLEQETYEAQKSIQEKATEESQQEKGGQ